ncbi:MAG: type III-A CRISPR-associated RAMP protein Csm3 [Candidatus Sigynarchaeota archaeon]
MQRFLKNIVFTGTIVLDTGLHIGGLKETAGIGGVDNPVIRTMKGMSAGAKPVPYIPGSSLKGKLRSLLELKYAGDIKTGEKKLPQGYCRVGKNFIQYPTAGVGSLIPRLFGIAADQEGDGQAGSITRLQIRDAFPSKATMDDWKQIEEIMDGTEVKAENTVDRITSAAMPRFFERVPAGARFDLEIVMTIFEGDDEKAMITLLKEGIALLEDNYLGGMGSRGYGKIHVDGLDQVDHDTQYYTSKAST